MARNNRRNRRRQKSTATSAPVAESSDIRQVRDYLAVRAFTFEANATNCRRNCRKPKPSWCHLVPHDRRTARETTNDNNPQEITTEYVTDGPDIRTHNERGVIARAASAAGRYLFFNN